MKKQMTNETREIKKLKQEIKDRSDFAPFIIGLVIGIVILIILLGILGVFDKPYKDVEDDLARSYVLEYYPEYKDCEIEYNSCVTENKMKCLAGVYIFCNLIDSRDSLKEVKEKSLTTSLVFEDDLTLDDIYNRQMRRCLNEK